MNKTKKGSEKIIIMIREENTMMIKEEGTITTTEKRTVMIKRVLIITLDNAARKSANSSQRM